MGEGKELIDQRDINFFTLLLLGHVPVKAVRVPLVAMLATQVAPVVQLDPDIFRDLHRIATIGRSKRLTRTYSLLYASDR